TMSEPSIKPAPEPGAPLPASLGAKLAAEGFGTFLLVFGGVGTALFASNHFTDAGANSAVYVAVALAFGLTVLVGAYAFGPRSGGCPAAMSCRTSSPRWSAVWSPPPR